MGDGHWQLEGSAAELYQRCLVPLITSKWAEDLVHRAELREGEDVLDVACGTGVVARLAVRKVAPGCVTGCAAAMNLVTAAHALSYGANWITLPPPCWSRLGAALGCAAAISVLSYQSQREFKLRSRGVG